MEKAEIIYDKLASEFGFKGSSGNITFSLNDFSITVEQNNIVGNILEEWLAKWMDANGIANIHNPGQSSPDFWLTPENRDADWLEVKSFTASPNFDVAAFRSFINLIIDRPYKLHSHYLLIRYKMHDGLVTIEDFWLKKIWEICSSSEKWPLKVQYKNNVIVNIRPTPWYSGKSDYPPFECLEDFLSALEETVYRYHDTHHLADSWQGRLLDSYKKFYGVSLYIPRWMDIKDKYKKR